MTNLSYRVAPWVLLAVIEHASAVQPTWEAGQAEAKKPPMAVPGSMVVRFIDDSMLKLVVRDPQVELQTPYGKLVIPIRDIQRIDLGRRISEDVAKQIEGATTKLASSQFRERENAGQALLALGAKAYPALLRAAKSKDPEVCRRAESLLDDLRQFVATDLLDMPDHDVVYTEHSKFSGKITTPILKVTTSQFGDLEVKLADVFSLRGPLVGDAEVEPRDVLSDPGHLAGYQNQVGKTFRFRVTGTITGSIWGTGVYTTDSTLALAAVHAGVLQPGQTGIVRVRIVASPPVFAGSTRNGVTSSAYGVFPAGFEVSR
jgi:hypothetical protein